jgi:hypothetical protein
MRLKQKETLQEYKSRLIGAVYNGQLSAQHALTKYERAYLVDQRRQRAQEETKTLIYC